MNIRYTLTLGCLLVCLSSWGQKKHFDDSTYIYWPSLIGAKINDDGRFITVTIKNAESENDKLLVYSTSGKVVSEFVNVRDYTFTADSKRLIVLLENDSLIMLNLADSKMRLISCASEFQLHSSNQEMLIYRVPNTSDFVLCELLGSKRDTIKNVSTLKFSSNGKNVYLLSGRLDDEDMCELFLINLRSRERTRICKSHNVYSLIGDDLGRGLAYVSEEAVGKGTRKVVNYFNIQERTNHVVLDQRTLDSTGNMEFRFGDPYFNIDGSKVFINVVEERKYNEGKNIVSLDVWRYSDSYLQSEQFGMYNERNFLYNVDSGRLAEICNSEAGILAYQKKIRKNVFIIGLNDSKAYYNKNFYPSLVLVNLDTPRKREIIIPPKTYKFADVQFSPDEKFLVWFNIDSLKWISYSIEKKVYSDLSAKVHFELFDLNAKKIGRSGNYGIAGWDSMKKLVFLYDEFDIWAVALDNSSYSENLTKGRGRSKKIVLTLMRKGDEEPDKSYDEDLILSAYDRRTKSGCYFSTSKQKGLDFDEKYLGNYSVMTRMPVGNFKFAYGEIKKAKYKDLYIILRQTATESLNVFFSKNLQEYRKISNINPERKYYWLSATLHEYTLPNGACGQGILYKPENFDSTKKYPVILNYYEKRSDELHKFIKPEYSSDNINIPTFVNHGYLVFVPDVYSSNGRNGEGTYNSIQGATNYIVSFPFVDSNRIGLQGHSYGGWQTNYMITHSTRYAAACEAAGVSDHVSGYGQLGYGNRTSRQKFYEEELQGSPYGIGITPWTSRDLYISNSPVFNVHKVVTPLLMMHNKGDGAVPFEQAIELYMGLRRAGKRVWLLQYDGMGHQLGGMASKDFNFRMLQFFNCYLKRELPPKWMTQGIPRSLKGVIDGFEIDFNAAIP